MKHKVLNALGGFVLGTLIFWMALFTVSRVWLAIQSDTVRKATIYYEPFSYETIVYVESRSIFEKDLFIKPLLFSSFDYMEQFLDGVKEFGHLKVGEQMPYGAYHGVQSNGESIPQSEFYVFVHRNGVDRCEFEECSISEGRIVRCMGGWLSGDSNLEISEKVGLSAAEVSRGKASIVVLADKNSKVIGIYPYHTEGDIREIFWQYPKYKKSSENCIDEEFRMVF